MIALWSYDIEVDTCPICKNLMQEFCIDCSVEENAE